MRAYDADAGIRLPVRVRIDEAIPEGEIRLRSGPREGEAQEWLDRYIDSNRALLNGMREHPDVLKRYVRARIYSRMSDAARTFNRRNRAPSTPGPAPHEILLAFCDRELDEETAAFFHEARERCVLSENTDAFTDAITIAYGEPEVRVDLND